MIVLEPYGALIFLVVVEFLLIGGLGAALLPAEWAHPAVFQRGRLLEKLSSQFSATVHAMSECRHLLGCLRCDEPLPHTIGFTEVVPALT